MDEALTATGSLDEPVTAERAAARLRWQYKLFWLVFLAEFVNPFYDFLYYIANIDIVFLFKIPLLALVAICGVFHLQYRLIVTGETLLFIVFGTFALVYGAIVNARFDSHFLTHMYTAVMPVLAMSFGGHFARDFDRRAKIFLSRVMTAAFYLSSTAVVLYLYFYYASEQIGYFGFGSLLPFVAAFLLAQRRFLKYLIALVLVIFSGKRASTISILGVTALYLLPRLGLRRLLRFKPRRILLGLVIASVAYVSFQYLQEHGYLRRFEQLASYDFSDDRAMFIASGGRWTEMQGVARRLGDNPLAWMFGAGMGAHFIVNIPIPFPYTEEMHYAHFSPMGYVLVYGAIFTVLLYFSMFRAVLKRLAFRHTFFFLAFVSLFAASFFGATLFVDPKPWFFYGVVKSLVQVRHTTPL